MERLLELQATLLQRHYAKLLLVEIRVSINLPVKTNLLPNLCGIQIHALQSLVVQ